MTEYDGSIRIGTGIDQKGFKAGSKELEAEVVRVSKAISKDLRDAGKLAVQKQTDAFVKLNQQYAAQEQKVRDIAAKLHDMQRQKVETPVFKETSKELESAEKRLDSLYGTLRRLEHEGKTDTKPYQNAITQIDIYKEKISDLKRDLKDLERSGEAYVPVDTSKVQQELTAAEQKQFQMYSALQTAADSLTLKTSERVEKEEAVRKKIADVAAEEERLDQIRVNAVAVNDQMIAKVERLKQLEQEIADLKKVNRTEGYADYDDRIKEASQLRQDIREYNNELTKTDTQRKAEAEELAKIEAVAAEEQRLADIKANATVSDQEILAVLERRKQLMAEIKDMEKVGVGFGYQEYENANKELQEINQKVKDYRKNLEKVPEKFENMRKSANKAFNAAASGTKKSSGLLSTFTSRFKGLALSLLIFNQISKAFNAMVSGMKKGFENLAGYSDSYAQSVQGMKNAMSTLGNQFAAAFSPIVQMVIPWLNSLIGALTTAMTYVSQFFAILGGKSTFTKAKKVQDSYNKSLGGTAAAADKARGALAKFDDLDVLEKKNDSGGGGGGAGDVATDLFEEVPVDNEVQSWLDNILDKLKTLQGIFAQGFWDGLGDWGNKWENIKTNASSIKDILAGIWTDPSVLSSANAWIESVLNMLGTLAGSVASIGLTIAENITGGISQYLDENKETIKEHLITMFDIGTEVNNMFSELFTSIAFVFEGFASEQGQQLTANIIGIFVGAFDGILEIAAKLARDILNVFIQPFVENKEEFRTALEGFLTVLSEVTGTIRKGIEDTFKKLNEVYDEHLKPFFDSIAEGLTYLAEQFMIFWNEQVQPVLDEWAEMFDTLWQEHIQPALDNFIELLGEVADFLKMVWENIFVPFLDWVIQNILPWALKITDGVVKALMAAAGGIADIINGVITVFRGVIEFLTGVFTGDWDKAWNGLVTIMKGIEDQFKGIINGILGAVEEMANGVVRAMNTVIHSLNSLHFDFPDWIPGKLGGKSFSLNLQEIPTVSIPRLATGAVIRGGNPFMAVLGDQPAGKVNIEAPLDTIKQAVREELSSTNLGGTGGGTLQLILNVNGEEFARATLNDWLSEMDRQGYDVSILGVT